MAGGFTSLEEALGWLDAHVDYESAMPSRRALPTLERIREFVALLGDPQRDIPSIHITGTNGKGSTAIMTTALLGAKGLSVGTYTSPNLIAVNERLSKNGVPIDDESFTEVLNALAALEPMLVERPTRFELLTAAALWWFADEAVDAMVIEVGVGGSWDCTNVVDGDVAVITNISYDHTEILGPTLEGIAKDKAGIIKPGCGVVIGETDPALVAVITEAAEGVGAGEIWVRDQEFGVRANRLAVGGRLVDLWTPGASYGELLIPAHGPHQGLNASCALAAVEAFFAAPLDEDIVDEGFASVVIPGRLEVIGRKPLTILDGAHNVGGMAALASALGEAVSTDGARVAVVGMLTGRDPSAMLEPLAQVGIASIVSCRPNSPRALDPEVVADAARALGLSVTVTGSVEEGLLAGRALVTDDGMLVVTGSLYVVGDARRVLLDATNHR